MRGAGGGGGGRRPGNAMHPAIAIDDTRGGYGISQPVNRMKIDKSKSIHLNFEMIHLWKNKKKIRKWISLVAFAHRNFIEAAFTSILTCVSQMKTSHLNFFFITPLIAMSWRTSQHVHRWLSAPRQAASFVSHDKKLVSVGPVYFLSPS